MRVAASLQSRATRDVSQRVADDTAATVQARLSSTAGVVQRQWVWSDDDDWWEEDDRGYIYDPETHEWQWGDDEDYANAIERETWRDLFRQELFRQMTPDDQREFLEDSTRALPRNTDIQEVDTNPLGFWDDEDEGVTISVMPELGAAEPVAVDFQAEDLTGSFGANTCVIVLMRASDGQNIYGGSIHLTATELASVNDALPALLSLRTEVGDAMGGAGNMVWNQCYAIGGEDEDDNLQDYLTLINTFELLGNLNLMNLVGARLPASASGGAVSAALTEDGVSFSRD